MVDHPTTPEATLAAQRKRAIADGTERRIRREAHAADQRAKALALRQSGATYAAIGAALGLSLERVRQIVRRAERLTNSPRWYDGLPMRAQHYLQIHGLADLSECEAAAAVAKLSRRELMSQPNLGKGAVTALADWLARHGHNFSPEKNRAAPQSGSMTDARTT